MVETFREQLIELWQGNIHHKREAVNYALDTKSEMSYCNLPYSPVMKRLGDWYRLRLQILLHERKPKII